MMPAIEDRKRRLSFIVSNINLNMSNAADYYRKNGFYFCLKAVFRRMGFQRFDRSLIFLVHDLDRVADDIQENYSFSTYTMDDFKASRYDYDDGFFSKSKALHRLKMGHRLFVLIEDGEIAFYLWIEQKGATVWWFNDLPIDMPKDLVYMSAVYTPPKFRNKGIASRMKSEIFHYLKSNGINRIIEVIHPKNEVALKVDRRLGFREYQIVRYRRYWYLRCYTVQKMEPPHIRRIITIFRSPKNIWNAFL